MRELGERFARAHPELARLGVFGSYATGNWGVGSDVDLIAIVRHSTRPFAERPLDFDLSGLPVPADLLVYTEDEWEAMQKASSPFANKVAETALWVR